MGFTVIDRRRIGYLTADRPSRRVGQRVLYIHGTGCNARVWQPHMAAIADTHTPVAIDLPGHGQSAGRGFRGIADYTYFAVELARALRWDRFVVVGHSRRCACGAGR
jgi:pimeloyl-ACP methyl ester carboxylesterase